MSPLFETIKVKDGQFFNLDFHNARMNRARKALLNCTNLVDLNQELYIPKSIGAAIHKCKVIYDQDIISIHFQPYHIRKIESLKMVQDNDIEYAYKFVDRSHLNNLFAKRENCDDVLIIKNGLVTDTSYANIIFSDGNNWFTPKHPLLEGTKRASLLAQHKIKAIDINIHDISRFKGAKIVNGLLNIEDTNYIDVQNIRG